MYVYFEVYDPTMDPDRKVPSLTAEVDLFSADAASSPQRPSAQNKLADKRPGVAPFASRFRWPNSRRDNTFPRST